MGLSNSGSDHGNLKLGREMSSEANVGIMVYSEDVPVWFGTEKVLEGKHTDLSACLVLFLHLPFWISTYTLPKLSCILPNNSREHNLKYF